MIEPSSAAIDVRRALSLIRVASLNTAVFSNLARAEPGDK